MINFGIMGAYHYDVLPIDKSRSKKAKKRTQNFMSHGLDVTDLNDRLNNGENKMMKRVDETKDLILTRTDCKYLEVERLSSALTDVIIGDSHKDYVRMNFDADNCDVGVKLLYCNRSGETLFMGTITREVDAKEMLDKHINGASFHLAIASTDYDLMRDVRDFNNRDVKITQLLAESREHARIDEQYTESMEELSEGINMSDVKDSLHKGDA